MRTANMTPSVHSKTSLRGICGTTAGAVPLLAARSTATPLDPVWLAPWLCRTALTTTWFGRLASRFRSKLGLGRERFRHDRNDIRFVRRATAHQRQHHAG